MKKYIALLFLALTLVSCDKKSKVEKAVEEIPVTLKVHRFDQAFFEATPKDLPNLKAEYPFFFPERYEDKVWIEKMENKDWRDLYAEVQKKYPDFSKQTTEIEDLFKHLKYYFPETVLPEVYTVIGEMDYNSKAIYANDKLIIALELYLGKDVKFYTFPEYLRQNFEERQIMPDIVSSYAIRKIPPPSEKTLLGEMIYYDKELYLKDLMLPNYTDAEKIGYLPEQNTWCQENES